MKTIRIELKIDNYFDLEKTVYYSPYESQPSNPRMSRIMSAISVTYASFSGTDKVKIDNGTLPLLTLKAIQDTWFYRFIMDIPYNEDDYDIIKRKLNHTVSIILGQYEFIMFYTGMISCEIIDTEDSILNKDYSRKIPTKSGDHHIQLFAADDNRNQFRLLLKINTLHYESADPIKVENLKYEDRCYLKDRIDSVKKHDSCITLTNFKNAISGTFGIDYIDFKNKAISVIVKAPYKDTGEFATYLFGSSTSIPDLHVFVSFTDENFKLTADLISCRLLKETEENKMYNYSIFIQPNSDEDNALLKSIVDNDISNYRIIFGSRNDKTSEYVISQNNTVEKLQKYKYDNYDSDRYILTFSSDKIMKENYFQASSHILFYPSRFGQCKEISTKITFGKKIEVEKEKKKCKYRLCFDTYGSHEVDFLDRLIDRNLETFHIDFTKNSDKKSFKISPDNIVKKLDKGEMDGFGHRRYTIEFYSAKDVDIESGYKAITTVSFLPSPVAVMEKMDFKTEIIIEDDELENKHEEKKYKYHLWFEAISKQEIRFLDTMIERVIDREISVYRVDITLDKYFRIFYEDTITKLYKVECEDDVYYTSFYSNVDIEPKYNILSIVRYCSSMGIQYEMKLHTTFAREEMVDANKVKIADYKPIVAYKLTLHPIHIYDIEILNDVVSHGTNFSIHRKDANILINCNKDRILKPMYKKLNYNYELFIKADIILSDGSGNLNDMECEITLYNDDNVIGYIKHILIDAEPIYSYEDITPFVTVMKSRDYLSPDIHYDGNELYTFASDGAKIVLTPTINDNTKNEEEKKDMEVETNSISITFKNGSMISADTTKYNLKHKYGRIDKMINKLIHDSVKSIIFHDPETKIIWKDGTETTVSCHDEKYDKEYGVVFCVLKKLLGNTSNYYDIIKNLVKLGDKQEKIRAKVKSDKEAKKLAKRRERQMKEAQEKDLLDSMVDSDNESNT